MNQEISLEEYKKALKVVWKKLMRDSIIAMVLFILVGILSGLGYIYTDSSFFSILFGHMLLGIWIILSLIHFIGTNKMDTIINKIEKGTYTFNLDEFKHAFRKALEQQYKRNIKIYLLISILILGILMYVFQIDIILVLILLFFIFVAPFAWDEIIEEIEEETMKKLSKQ